MTVALLLGREGSGGFPGKNVYPVLGRALMEYPLLAVTHAISVDKIYVSTDSEKIKNISKKYNASVIHRPAYLCTKEALGEDAFVHGYNYIKNELNKPLDFIVLLFCNAPCILSSQIDEAVEILKKNSDYDSVITVSSYNMYSPIRARKIGKDGLLHPFIPLENYPKEININCDRNSQGDVYFADVCLSVVRPRCLENIKQGTLPQKWMGNKIFPLKQWGGLDVDFEWQLPQVEYWLKKHGFTETITPYRKKQDRG